MEIKKNEESIDIILLCNLKELKTQIYSGKCTILITFGGTLGIMTREFFELVIVF